MQTRESQREQATVVRRLCFPLSLSLSLMSHLRNILVWAQQTTGAIASSETRMLSDDFLLLSLAGEGRFCC